MWGLPVIDSIQSGSILLVLEMEMDQYTSIAMEVLWQLPADDLAESPSKACLRKDNTWHIFFQYRL